MVTILRRWWTEKYRLPWTHSGFQNATIFDLLVEYYEDIFEEDPKAMLAAARTDDGEVIFEETGDPLIDKWEREMAQGITPDLTEGLPDDVLEQLKKNRDKNRKVRQLAKELDSIDLADIRMGKGAAPSGMGLRRGLIGDDVPRLDPKNLLGGGDN